VRLLARLLAAVAAWRAVRRGAAQDRAPLPPPPPPEPDPRARRVGARADAERLVAALLIACGLCGVAFVVVYATSANTQLLGAAAGLALVLLAVALAVASFAVVPQETAVEPRPPLEAPAEVEPAARELRDVGEGVSRRGLITAAAGVAGAGLAAAAITPAASLGPRAKGLGAAPWRRGTRLLDQDGRPLRAAALVVGAFATAFAEGADRRELGSPVVVVRLREDEVHLPAARRAWAPQGILAFSKICTHAGCAVSLFRYPLDQQTSKTPALVCPCHYSTFDPRRAGRVEFGPAGRPLPQLPLAIAADGTLVAAGPMSGPIGPAWWGVGHS
jgi:ubiquinol-cytochrome c reductase iron-sulfur subunit